MCYNNSMKIIDGLRPFGSETNKFYYYLCGNYSSYAIKLHGNCSTKNDVFIGDMWVVSWKPLGFERCVMYG